MHMPNAEQPKDALADVFAMRVADWSEPQCGCINSRNSALEADLGKSLCEQFHAMTGESERLRHIENQGLFESRQIRKKAMLPLRPKRQHRSRPSSYGKSRG